MTDEQRKVLDDLQERVLTKPLSFYDDTTPGAHSMGCTWGLCYDETERSGTRCPLDTRLIVPSSDGSGCFWFCRVFKAHKTMMRRLPTREETLRLIEISRLVLDGEIDPREVMPRPVCPECFSQKTEATVVATIEGVPAARWECRECGYGEPTDSRDRTPRRRRRQRSWKGGR